MTMITQQSQSVVEIRITGASTVSGPCQKSTAIYKSMRVGARTD